MVRCGLPVDSEGLSYVRVLEYCAALDVLSMRADIGVKESKVG